MLVDILDGLLQFGERAPAVDRKGLELLQPLIGKLVQAGGNLRALLVEVVS